MFLDAESLDGTREYLAGIADASSVRVEVLRGSESDLGVLLEQAQSTARGENDSGAGMFALRPRQSGMVLACCRDLFVHNLGSLPSEG